MTIDEIIAAALDMFDEPASTDGKYNRDGNVLLTRLANQVYLDVCERARCYRTTANLVTVSGAREYALPVDYSAMKKVTYDEIPLIPIMEGNAINQYGSPIRYYIVGTDRVGFDPKPYSAYDITLHYYAVPTVTLTASDVPSMVPAKYHYVIAEGITTKLFLYDKGDQSAGYVKWSGIYENSLNEMRRKIHRNTADKFASLG